MMIREAIPSTLTSPSARALATCSSRSTDSPSVSM
jgi:hypothetical protein